MHTDFSPPRSIGLLLTIFISLVLAGGGGFLFYRAVDTQIGLEFILQMLAALMLLLCLPFTGYTLYALLTSAYQLQREGLRIRWGLRREDIPINQLEWVQAVDTLDARLPLPMLHLPGVIVGKRQVEGLGKVEYLATDRRRLVLVATADKAFVISPMDVDLFIETFHQINELGSLSAFEAQSIHPALFLTQLWQDKLARRLWLASLVMVVLLVLLVTASVPFRPQINWQFNPNIPVAETAPGVRLFLLPILNGLVWVVDLILGFSFYRREDQDHLPAYLIWGASCLTGSLLFIAAILLIAG